MQETMENAT